MIDSVIALSRRLRWWVIANRCASSRTRWSSCSSGVSCGSTIGVGSPGVNTSSIRFASETTATPRSRKPGQRLQPRGELALAAVDHDQVRQRGERRVALGVVRRALVLLLPLRVAARQDLRHRRVIIAGIDLANRETPVIALLRRAALEHHHRRDGVGAADVRDVEALDPHRQRVQLQRLLEPVQRVDALLAPALGLELLLVEREPRVALGEVEDPALAAALGGADLDRPAAPLGQHLARARRARIPRSARPGRPPATGSRACSSSTGA